MATYRCGNCGYSQPTSDALVGKKVKCPKCGGVGVVSAALSPLEEAAQQMVAMTQVRTAPAEEEEIRQPVPPPKRVAFSSSAPSASPTGGDDGQTGTDLMKNCPFCDEEIRETAQKCKHCGEFLNDPPEISPPPQKTRLSDLSKRRRKPRPSPVIQQEVPQQSSDGFWAVFVGFIVGMFLSSDE